MHDQEKFWDKGLILKQALNLLLEVKNVWTSYLYVS